MFFKIKEKILQDEGTFEERVLSHSYNFEKLAVNTMLVKGREEQKKWKSKLKGTLEKKQEINLMYDKKTQTVGILITYKKKPVKVLQVFELIKEDDVNN